MSESNMAWPSKRVSKGGIFHAPTVKYSPETNDLVKLLMEEAKMTMMVRKNINYHLRNGSPLPLPEQRPRTHHEEKELFGRIVRRARSIRKKPLESIVASGAYEQPKYRPKADLKEPIEKAKLRLQEKMSGFKMSTTHLKPKKAYKEPDISLELEDRIDELLDEINERAEWLAEMEEIGEGKKHRELIHSQIAEKLSEIKTLHKQRAKQQQLTQECDQSTEENSSQLT